MAATEPKGLFALMHAIADGEDATVLGLLDRYPDLAQASAANGAGRASPEPWFLERVKHYVYAGDTALHVAAAAYRPDLVEKLIALGADVRARNRRGAEPLHYAADGSPDWPVWDPKAQAETIACLVEAGADPNAGNQDGATPLHRAARTRCAAAVRAFGARRGPAPAQPGGVNRHGAGSPDDRTGRCWRVRSSGPAAQDSEDAGALWRRRLAPCRAEGPGLGGIAGRGAHATERGGAEAEGAAQLH